MSALLEHKAIYLFAAIVLAIATLLLLAHGLWLEPLLIVVAGLLAAGGLWRSRQLLAALEQDASHLGDGDLTRSIPVEQQGQYQLVARGLARMSEDVGRTVSALMDTSESMNLVAADLKQVSDVAAKGVASQEQRTEEAASSMAQMVNTVHDISANAARVASSVDEAKSRAVQGGRVVNRGGRPNQCHDRTNQPERTGD